MRESKVVDSILIDASKNKSRLFVNHNGLAVLQDGSVVKYGLGKGTSDLVGPTTITITEEMVGKEIAVFTAIEVKKGGWKMPKKLTKHLQQQINFRNIIIKLGGISGFANSVEQYQTIIGNYINDLKNR